MVVPSLAAPGARSAVRTRLGDLPVVERAAIGERIAAEPEDGDLLIHSVPDVFGRILSPPAGWDVLVVVDRATGASHDAPSLTYGTATEETPAVIADRLQRAWKPLIQQRGVRPVLGAPAPFGLAFVAPDGLMAPDGLAVTPVDLPGLADLVVVHHPHARAWAPDPPREAYDGVRT